MSPVSTALPPPSIEILHRFWGPCPPTYTNHGENQSAGSRASCTASQRFYRMGDNDPYSPLQEVLNSSGTGVVERWRTYKGRRCHGTFTGSIRTSAAWAVLPPGGDPIYDAGAVNPGARVNEQAAVFSLTEHFALETLVAPADDDRTGFFFTPWAPQYVGATAGVYPRTPAGGEGGGFGLFLQDDGAGAPVWEYVAWDAATVVRRVAVPASVIPDVTLWSSARFTIISGGSDAATLIVDVNGTEIVNQSFDNVTLFAPAALSIVGLNGVALGYMPAFSVGPLGDANQIFSAWEGWQGRFTPQGVAVTSI